MRSWFLDGSLVGECRYANHGVTFNLDSAKVFLRAIFDSYFSNHKYIWIPATDYYRYFYLILLFPLTATLQIINFTSFIIFSIQINAVILLLNSLVLILNFVYFFSFLKVIFSTSSLTHGVENYFPGVSNAIS